MGDNRMLQMVLDKVTSLEKKIDVGFSEVKSEIVKNRERIDKFGLELAELADDAPTREEHEELEERIGSIEKQATIQ